jgi:hypothetical protein
MGSSRDILPRHTKSGKQPKVATPQRVDSRYLYCKTGSEGKPHDYLPDVVGTLADGTPFIAEEGMEDDKRSDRNLAKAEAARRLARI